MVNPLRLFFDGFRNRSVRLGTDHAGDEQPPAGTNVRPITPPLEGVRAGPEDSISLGGSQRLAFGCFGSAIR